MTKSKKYIVKPHPTPIGPNATSVAILLTHIAELLHNKKNHLIHLILDLNKIKLWKTPIVVKNTIAKPIDTHTNGGAIMVIHIKRKEIKWKKIFLGERDLPNQI